eukprot:SAG22_NODE_626_length_8433_cov_43.291097_4_plen_122_part_00
MLVAVRASRYIEGRAHRQQARELCDHEPGGRLAAAGGPLRRSFLGMGLGMGFGWALPPAIRRPTGISPTQAATQAKCRRGEHRVPRVGPRSRGRLYESSAGAREAVGWCGSAPGRLSTTTS